MLNFACISPHPPLIIPTIGAEKQRTKTQKTINSLKKIGENFREKDIDHLLLVSPHLPLHRKKFNIFANNDFKGDLRKFGDLKSKFSFTGSPKLAKKLHLTLKKNNLPSNTRKLKKLDHGSLVPLYFLTENKRELNLRLLPITFCDISLKKHFQAGKLIGEILEKNDAKIGVCASGDLSHRLKKGAPAGYNPKGQKFDQKLTKLIKEKKSKEILNLDKDLIEKAGECGLRSIILLLGIMETQKKWKPEVFSYQGPFGVGYLSANFQLFREGN